jgi:hypothetical protein
MSITGDDIKLSERLYIPSKKLRGFERGKVGPKDGKDFIGGNSVAAINFSSTLPGILENSENADFLLFMDIANIWGVDYNSSLDNSNKILIRRKIVSLKELKQMLHLPMFGRNEINKIISNLPIEMIPDNFFCPILHDIMICPVKTIDGHVYDRNAIISWFRVKNTSPLTGLPLESTLLTPDTEVKKEINTFLISLVKLENK